MPKIILFPSPFQLERTLMDVNPGTTVRGAVELAKPFLRFDGALLVHNDRRVGLSDAVLEGEDTLIVRAVPAGGVGDAIGRAGSDAWKVMGQMIQNPFLVVTGLFLIGGAMTFLYSLGSSAASSLLPKPPHFDTSTTNGSLGLHGGRNAMKPYTPVPLILGKSIISPPMGSKVFTDWDGSTPARQVLTQVFVVGLGRLAVTAAKIGDRLVADFGNASATPPIPAPTLTIQTLTNDTYGKIVTESGIGIELKQVNGGITAVSVADIDAMSLDIVFPSGLTSYNSDGNRTTSRTIGLTVEYKKTTTGTWTGAASFALSYAENFTQAITKKADITQAMLNAAGRAGYTGTWDVRVTRNTSDSGDSKQIDRTSWSVLRSIQLKEPMSAAAKGITTRVALTIQATDQLNGAVDNFNCEAQSVVPCYDGTGSGASEWNGATALGYPSTWKNVNMTTGGYTWNTWTGNATSNPAALYLWILRGPANPKPIPDTLIDWPAFEAWYTFCASKGLEVNAVWDQGGAMLDLLDKIAGTGRAASMMRDSKYSVIFDQPQSVPVQHFTPRNSRNFSASKAFPTPVHAIRSQFIDKDSAWKQAEQIVYMAGYSAGTATEFRTQQLWGVTNYQQAYKAIFYQVAVETLRPEVYQMEVDFEHLACQRGDLVAVSHDVLLYGLQAARVVSLTVNGGSQALTVTLDEDVTMEVGKSYGIRWRRMDGTSVVAPVNLTVGTTRTLTFTTPVVVGSVPEVDDLCSFGISGSETQAMLVVSIEMQDEFAARVTLNNYDPAVYTADGGAIPAWSSGISLPAPVGYGEMPDLSVPTTAPVAAPTRAADTAYVDAQKQFYPSDTALSFRLPLSDMPELPDNAAGIVFRRDAWATSDVGVYVRNAGGTLASLIVTDGVAVATYTGSNGIMRFSADPRSKTVIFDVMVSDANGVIINNDSNSSVHLPTANTWARIIKAFDSSGAAYVDVESSGAGKVVKVRAFYIGDVSYEGTTLLQDTSPSALKLSCQTGVVRVPGLSGYAVDTTYGGLYSASEAGLPMGNSARSIVIPFRKASGVGGQLFCYGKWGTAGQACLVNHSGGYFNLDKYGTVIQVPDTGYLDGKDHQLAVTFDGTNAWMYLDGVMKLGPTAWSFSTVPSSGVSVGQSPVGTEFSPSQQSRPLVYSACLSAAEVLGLYAQTPAPDAKATEVAVVQKAPKYLGKWLDTAPTPGNIGDTYTRYSTTGGATNRGVFRWNGVTWDRTEDPQYLVGHAIDDISQIITYKNTSGSAIYGSAADYSGDSTVQSTFGFFWLAVIQQLQASVIKAIGMTVDGSNNVTAGMEIDLVNSRIRSPQFRARGKAGDGDPLSLGPVSAPTLRAKEDGTLVIGSVTVDPAYGSEPTRVQGHLRPKTLYTSRFFARTNGAAVDYDVYFSQQVGGISYGVALEVVRVTVVALDRSNGTTSNSSRSHTQTFTVNYSQGGGAPYMVVGSSFVGAPVSRVTLAVVDQHTLFVGSYKITASVTAGTDQELTVLVELLSYDARTSGGSWSPPV